MSDEEQTNKISKAHVNGEVGLLKVGDRNIHYTWIHRNDNFPTAVFIHGSPGSSSNFIYFTTDSLLLRSYNVLLFDRPGYGQSDFGKSEPLISNQAKILNNALHQLDIKNPVLVGHSLGGPIIAKMAMDEPNYIKGLLIVAGSVSPELEPEEKWRKPMSRPILRWLLPKMFRVSNDEILPAKEELIRMEPFWPKITCEMRVIQGQKDKLVPAGNEDYAKKMAVNSKKVTLIKLDDNHFIPFNTPELVTRELLLFER